LIYKATQALPIVTTSTPTTKLITKPEIKKSHENASVKNPEINVLTELILQEKRKTEKTLLFLAQKSGIHVSLNTSELSFL
jgi:hypothetical protein